jgi:hypothetical protein
MGGESSRKTFAGHKCGDCARFKVPDSGCDNAYDISKGILLARDPACDKFLEKGSYELGNYVFKIKRDLMLVYEGEEPRYPIKISSLDSLTNRQALAKSLGLEQNDVDSLAAKILADHETSNNKKPSEEETKPSTPSEIQKRALEILEKHDSIEYIADVVQLIHHGDREKSKFTWLGNITPGLGYELDFITVGKTGIGKSDLLYAVLATSPDEYVVRLKECSQKAIYYASKAGVNFDKMAIYFDDVPDNPETVKLLKDITSENRADPRLWSVDKEREFLDIQLTGDFAVFASAIKNLSDEGDQVVRRFAVINPDENPDANKEILEKIKNDMRYGKGKRWLPPEFEIAKEVTRQIKEADYKVYIPFDFEFPDYGTLARSELKQFTALVWAVAKARFKQRLTVGKMLFAEPQDLETAISLWNEKQPLKIAESAVQILKELPKEEPQLVYGDEEKVPAYTPEPITSTTLARKLKEKPRVLRDILEHLYNMGYVDRKAIGGRGNPYAYWQGPVSIQNGKGPNDLGDSQTPKSLSSIRLKNLENSVNDYYAQIKTQYQELDMEKVHEKYMERISLPFPGFRRNNHKPELSPICENKPNDLGESETPKSPAFFSEPSKSSSDVNDHFSVNNKERSQFDLNSSVTEDNVLGWLRLNWKGGTQAEFDELLKSQGYNTEQAAQLRQKWLNQGLLRQHSGSLVWIDGEDEKRPMQQLGSREMLELLHNELPGGREFSEQQFLGSVVRHGWSREQHDTLFQKLVDEGSIMRTPGGGYIWA